MAIYRFKISFEDYDDVVREIDIKSNQTFESLHHAIHESTKYNPEISSSFYVSNDHWIKGDEIAYLPSERKINNGVVLMTNSKLSAFIDDPHQKFYYTYNFERPFDFHVELIKIILNEEAGKTYPNVFRSSGEVPRLAGTGLIPPVAAVSEEFDFLNELEYNTSDTDELSTMTDLGISDDEAESEEEEESDEFSNENYDEDDLQKEDY
ncbi:plasmid pRiA4b ORF-3 family protein [Flavihumibacter sp. R14]|nr:plasmid pRiA4b ORF-3 family protein [Flavihumibacter soli]